MKTLLIMLTTILLVSCDVETKDREVSNWIGTHTKPIICKETYLNGHNFSRKYTLIDANNNIVSTDWTTLSLPDTIKVSKESKLRDYQLDIVEDYCYIYDGNRLVGKCPMKDNMIEQLITIDNQ